MKRGAESVEREIIESIYSSLYGDGSFLDTLRKIQHYMHADRAVIRSVNLHSNKVLSSLATSGSDSAYEQAFQERSFLLIQEEQALVEKYAGKEGMVQYAAIPKFFETTENGDFMRSQRVGNVAGGYFHSSSGLESRIGLYRYGKPVVYGEKEMKRLEVLFPHLRTSFHTLSHLQSITGQVNAAQVALDQLPIGIILLNANLELVYMNRISEAMLIEKSGLYLKDFRIHASVKVEEDRLQYLMAAAAATARGVHTRAGESLIIHSIRDQSRTRENEQRPGELQLLVCPVFPNSSGENPNMDWSSLLDGYGNRKPSVLLMIFATDRELSQSATELLQALYDLTSTEASLAMALAAGRTPEEYAAFYGITSHTPRQQLKSIFRKMGVHRQVELVKLVLAGPAGWIL